MFHLMSYLTIINENPSQCTYSIAESDLLVAPLRTVETGTLCSIVLLETERKRSVELPGI